MFGVGSIPWSPIARGVLSRPLDAQSKRAETDWYAISTEGVYVHTSHLA